MPDKDTGSGELHEATRGGEHIVIRRAKPEDKALYLDFLHDVNAEDLTAAERGELRNSIDSLVKDLDNLRSRLDRLPKLGRNVARTPTVDLRVWPIHLRSVKTRASHVSFS